MVFLLGSDVMRRNIAKWISLVLAFIFLYASLFQAANYSLILGWKLFGVVPLGFAFGIIFAYGFYLYHNRGLL